ncbi:MAG: shikimate dehydrogenase [Opitutales bacterium]|nr:shikimate dehydrogenase [Opitutales bacterium]
METDTPLSLADLPNWSFAGTALTVVGFPIKHSLSPPMHNAALRAMAVEAPELSDWRYFRCELQADDLCHALPVFADKGVRGINLTIPHKVEVIRFLNEVDPVAARMGAVNTLLLEDGRYRGTNTDGYGIAQAVRETLGAELGSRPVILLGAGGAARAIAVQCLMDGSPAVWVGNRSADRLHSFLQALGAAFPQAMDRVRTFPLDSPPHLSEPVWLINATALGLRSDDPPPFEVAHLPGGSGVYDTTYGVENALARAARAAGVPYADGLSMLVWQGARSLSLWTGREVPADIMAGAVRKSLAERAK